MTDRRRSAMLNLLTLLTLAATGCVIVVVAWLFLAPRTAPRDPLLFLPSNTEPTYDENNLRGRIPSERWTDGISPALLPNERILCLGYRWT